MILGDLLCIPRHLYQLEASILLTNIVQLFLAMVCCLLASIMVVGDLAAMDFAPAVLSTCKNLLKHWTEPLYVSSSG